MDLKDKIAKARIQLLSDHPFFGYFALYLKPIEGGVPTIGVDDRGNLYYNPAFLKQVRIAHLKSIIAHEVLHIALMHPLRVKGRDRIIWNIACDLVVNEILRDNRFELPSNAVMPRHFGIDVRDKTAEAVYEELRKKLKKAEISISVSEYEEKYKTDDHSKWSGKGRGKAKPESEIRKIERSIKRRLAEAYQYAKTRGKTPYGLERIIEDVLYPKLPWRAILWNFITRHIVTDYTYIRPSKKSVSAGVYLPSVKRENLNLLVAIDTSGSISPKELNEFAAEIIGIARSFEHVRLHVVTCDAEIHDKFDLTEKTAHRLLKMKVHGGGGTDFRPVFEYAKGIDASALIYLTDGYGIFPNKETIKTIWVVSKGGQTKFPFGVVARLGDGGD